MSRKTTKKDSGHKWVKHESPAPHRDVVPLQGLDDEVGHHPAIVEVHPRPVGVEDPGHPHGHLLYLLIRVGQGLGHPLGLVIASPWPCGGKGICWTGVFPTENNRGLLLDRRCFQQKITANRGLLLDRSVSNRKQQLTGDFCWTGVFPTENNS